MRLYDDLKAAEDGESSRLRLHSQAGSAGSRLHCSAVCAIGMIRASMLSAGVVLGHPLHMVYLCLLEHPFAIYSWRQWLSTLSNLSESSR